MTRFSVQRSAVAAVAVATLVGALVCAGGTAYARSVKLTKIADVGTRLFTLKKVSVDHPLGKLRIRGWDKKLVRIRAVKRGPDAATVSRLKVHVNINKNGSGAVEIRTGVLMKVHKLKDPRHTLRLVKKISVALNQLKKQPKPWTTRNRQQIRKLYRQRNAMMRALQEAVTSKLVAKLRAVPIKGASLQLVLYVPRGVIVEGRTTKGDIDVANLRGPVTLSSRRGRIYARNVKGAVSTRTDKGHQYLSSIRGAVSANAYEGDLRLRSVSGAHILATLVRGHIFGLGLNAPLVRLTTTRGDVTVTATLKASGRIVVRTRRGKIDVRVVPRTGYRFRLQTRYGSVSLPRGARNRTPSLLRKRGRYGRGGGLVDLRTVYGNVKLH